MKNKVKKLISFVMLGVMSCVGTTLLSACSSKKNQIDADVRLYSDGMEYVTTEKGTPVEYSSLSFEYLGGSDVMPIGGFYGPTTYGAGSIDGNVFKETISDEVFDAISDCGVNMIVYGREMWGVSGANELILDLCEKYGIGYFMQLEYVESQLGGHTTSYPVEDMELNTDAGVAKLQSILDDLTKNGTRKCVIGIHGKDEPFLHEVRNLSVFLDVFNNKLENNYGLKVFGNMLGHWSGEWTMFGTTSGTLASDYYDYYFDAVNPSMMSVTQYPWGWEQEPYALSSAYRSLFDGLALYRMYSEKYDVPFWRMMQAGGNWNDAMAWIESGTPYPTEGQILMDVNAALAFGAKAIQYFPLVEPIYFAYEEGGTYDFDRNGLIAANGSKTRWWYYAKRANQQVQAVDEYLMNAANLGIIVHGDDARKLMIDGNTYAELANPYLETEKFRQLTDIAGDDCFIGCFDYKGGTALYVVNYSCESKSNVTLKFDGNYRYNVIQRAESCDVVGTAIPLTLDAGEGALIVLK